VRVRFPAVVALFATAAVSFGGSACSPAPSPGGQIALSIASPKSVLATGLSSAETDALAAARLSTADMQRVLRVRVAAVDAPVAGSYAVRDGVIEFTPAFPLDAGRSYTIELSQDAIPTRTRTGMVAVTASLPAPDLTPVTKVISVSPTAERWPANLLRAYIYFSGPMGRESGVGRITLRDEHGVEVTDAFLPLDTDFWNSDHTRYTLFFDPGRVKRGILPNRQRGRALVNGQRYTLEIDATWRDAAGRPLVRPFRHAFQAGPAIEKPMAVGEWTLAPPKPHGREPLVVTFPWPMDSGLAQRAFAIVGPDGQPVAGDATLAPGDVRWSFTPRTAWTAGEYRLTADPMLEDPAGNQVGRAFEVDMKRAPTPPPNVPRSRVFTVTDAR
jgi:hypothetical protein